MVEELLATADDLEIDLILFAAGSGPSSTDSRRYMWQFEGHHTQLAVVPSLVDVAADRVRTRPLAGLPLVLVEGPAPGEPCLWGSGSWIWVCPCSSSSCSARCCS